MPSRFCAVLLAVFACMGHAASAQQPAPLAFEVATIRPVQPDARMIVSGVFRKPTRINAFAVTLADLIRDAYGRDDFLLDDQIAGVPAWAKSQRYDVVAKFTEDDSTALAALSPPQRDQRIGLMLQSLLADRFHLTLHRSTRQSPVYELVTNPSFKLQPLAPATPEAASPGLAPQTRVHSLSIEGPNRMRFNQYSMDQVASFLTTEAHELGRPVLDCTSLTGLYTFSINWLSNGVPRAIAGASTDPEPPSIFTALQEVGLKLKPSTAPIPTLTIDRADPPSAN